jgi:hypothetical protein
MTDLFEILDQASQTEAGIALRPDALGLMSPVRALFQLRRRLYRLRERARARGNLDYDHLAFLIRPPGEMWIMPARAINQKGGEWDGDINIRPLSNSELPAFVRSPAA